MKGFQRVHIAMTALVVGLVLGFIFAGWWSRQVPGRPKSVAANAVFLWAPDRPLPTAKRGSWLSCVYRDGNDVCTLSSMKGKVIYQGSFATYHGSCAVPQGRLVINTDKTGQYGIFIGNSLVPFIYLKGGEILLPTVKYEESVHFLSDSPPD